MEIGGVGKVAWGMCMFVCQRDGVLIGGCK